MSVITGLMPGRGVRFPRSNERSPEHGIVRMDPPTHLYIPLFSSRDDKVTLLCRPGTAVSKSQPIAVSERVGNICSPVSGTLLDIENRRVHRVGSSVACAHIIRSAQPIPEVHAPFNRTAEQLIDCAGRLAIIDSHDRLPLRYKLEQAARRGCELLVIDALDDQPFTSAGAAVLREHPRSVAVGIELIKKALPSVNECFIAAVGNIGGQDLASSIGSVRIRNYAGRYPAFTRVRDDIGQKDALVIGIWTLCRLLSAADGHFDHTGVITVDGDGVDEPRNIEFTAGTTVEDLLSFAGVKGDINRVVCGGVMTGRIISPLSPLTADMKYLSVLRHSAQPKETDCIGCGKCIRACPAGIMPLYIMQAARSKKTKDLELFEPARCIGCGCCSYVCPAGIEVCANILSAAKEAAK